MLREETSTFAHIHHFERQKFCNKNMESIISNSLESLRIVLNSLEKTYAELRSMQIDAMTLLPTRWWENRCEIQNLSGVLFGNETLLRDFCTQQHIVQKRRLGYILLINQSTNSSTYGSFDVELAAQPICSLICMNAYFCILLPWSVRT